MNLLRRGSFFSIILCLFAIYSIPQTNLAGISGKVSGTNNTPLPVHLCFDPATNTYKYAVNTNAGVSALSGNPYQVQIGVRYGF